MNKGYRIEIEKGLSFEQQKYALRYADKFIKETSEDGGYWNKRGGGGRTHCYKRGTLGWHIGYFTSPSDKEKDLNLVFRRKLRNKRVFVVMQKKHLRARNTEYNTGQGVTSDTDLTGLKMCPCPKCYGSIHVELRYPVETYIYHEEGVING